MRRHVGGLAIQVHRQDRARPGSNRARDLIRIEREAHRIDVREDRTRAGHHDRERRVRGRQRRGDDFVARADAERAQDERDRVGPCADAHGMRRAHRSRELGFERLDLGAEHEPAARDDTIDGGADVVPVVTRHERQEGDAPRNPWSHTRSGDWDSGASLESLESI